MECGQVCEEVAKMLIAISGYKIAIGLFLGWGLAIFIGQFFAKLTRKSQKNLEEDTDSSKLSNLAKDKWKKVINIGDKLTEPTKWLGISEVTLFYICLFFMPAGIGVWLAFKVAVKWESWANITKVPDVIKDGENKVDDFEYLELRNKLATVVSQKFLIGTVGNILAAFIGFGIFCIIKCL